MKNGITNNNRVKGLSKPDTRRERMYLCIILSAGLLLRLLTAPTPEGHPIDMGCFKAWAQAAAGNLMGFYDSKMFVDYPPVYIYVLFMMGKIINTLGAASTQWAHTLLVKLPSIIADLVTAWMLYRLAAKYNKVKIGLLAAALYVFNPAILVNSTVWGPSISPKTNFKSGSKIGGST